MSTYFIGALVHAICQNVIVPNERLSFIILTIIFHWNHVDIASRRKRHWKELELQKIVCLNLRYDYVVENE